MPEDDARCLVGEVCSSQRIIPHSNVRRGAAVPAKCLTKEALVAAHNHAAEVEAGPFANGAYALGRTRCNSQCMTTGFAGAPQPPTGSMGESAVRKDDYSSPRSKRSMSAAIWESRENEAC